MPENENISFNDMIRGEVHFDTGIVDDKVLLKARWNAHLSSCRCS